VRRGSLVAMLVAAVALAVTDRVVAGPATLPAPVDLRVAGGEGGWQADPRFTLEWSPAAADPPVVAVGYRLRNAAGAVLREARREGDRPQLEVQVPPAPGPYTVEVWMEGAGGDRGPTRSTVLRYDDARPGVPEARAGQGWAAGAASAAIEILPPPGPPPISGIGGYAVAVDRGGESRPCAAADRCTEAETDLPKGEGGALSLGSLPEGVRIVRVVAVSGAGVPSSEPGVALVRVDATRPEVTLSGAPGGWVDGPVRVTATATDAISGMAPTGPNGPFTAIALDGGVPRAEPGDSAALTVTGEGAHRIDAYARDGAGNVDPGRPRTASVAIDETAPRVHFADRQDPAEPERIEATVLDALSGPDSGRGSIAMREAGSADAWRPLPTVTADGRLIGYWDSAAHPEGVYEFRATGYDLAGNAGSSNRRANHTRMVLVNPLKTPVRLEAGFGDERPTRTIAYGRKPVLRGRLSTASDTPPGALRVQIVESFGPGTGLSQRVTAVTTATDGGFALRLPRGPSREVTVTFAGSRILGRAVSEPSLLRVRGGVTMRASTAKARVGGAPVVFSGRIGLLGTRIPTAGLSVELQFRVPGGDWAEFRTVQTDARGRFRYPYAFSDDDSRGVRFRFRAYMSGGGWPYAPAASKAISVTGR
jgi:hypothetical protein